MVADDEVEHEVFATAMRIAEGAPLVARWHKKFTRRLMQPEALDEEMDESSTASEPRASGRATGRSWPRANPSSGVGEQARPRALWRGKTIDVGGREMSIERRVAEHYARVDVGAAIIAALEAAGKDVSRLSLDDLAQVDEFHARAAHVDGGAHGRPRPERRDARARRGQRGRRPSRCVAATYGCHVVGIDLTEEFCRAAACPSG